MPGIIYLEIDGLALPVLRRAMRDGNAPNMARWLAEGTHWLTEWETDLSSQTGASQAGILLGSNDDIPAFRWVDKESGTLTACSAPADCARIERERATGIGLLVDGGSSRGNLLSGEAEEVILTVSRMEAEKRANPGYRAFFANGFNVTRALVLFGWEVILEWTAALRAIRRDVRPRGHRGGIYPFMRGAMCVVVRDLIVYGVLTDMMRGRPAVYATFSSYDEVAHHSGLERADTLEALRKLDQQFGRIDRARRYAPRPYEIVVLSDHGQTQGATFKQRNGYGLDELVERSLEHGTVEEVAGGDEQHAMVGLAVGEATGRADEQTGKRAKNDVSDREVVVLGSGNLGLISLMEEPRRLTLEEIDERHPRLIPALRAHPHVGWILVRSVGARRRSHSAPPAPTTSPRARVEGEDPLAPFAPNAPRHLLRTDGFAHVADIMVGSFYDPELEEGCAFEELISFHGGIGGPQTRPFILHPVELAAPGRARSSAPSRCTACSRAGGSCSRAASGPAPASAPHDEPRLGGARRRRCSRARRGGDAARAAARSRGQSLHRRRPGVGRLRRAGDRILGAARLRRLPRLRELRPVASGGRAGGARARRSRSRPRSSWARPSTASSPASWCATAGRSSHLEWPRMEAGTQGDEINPWGVELFRTFKTVQPETPSEEAAYGKWLDQTSDREAARIDRIHGAVGVIPTPLWVVLLLISGVVFVFMLFFADSGEGAVTQAVLMGSVATVVVSMLLLIRFLDSPFHDGSRRRPSGRDGADAAHRRRGAAALSAHASTLPCDARGNPRLVNACRSGTGSRSSLRSCSRCRAVATAWSSYQATRWNGEQAKTSGSVNKTRIEAARASDLANAQQQVDVATFIAVGGLVRARRDRARELLSRALSRRVQARVRGVDRDEAAQDGGRPADAVRDAGVPAGGQGRSRSPRPARRGARGAGAAEHPAGVELRARRRALRGRALLRGHEHEAHRTRHPQGDAGGRLHRLPGHRRLDRDVPGERRGLADSSSLQESASLKAASSSPPASSCSSSANVD